MLREARFKKGFVFSILLLGLIFSSTVSRAASEDLSLPENWFFFGTSYPFEHGFLVGDTDGYTTGDSCWSNWFGNQYDYDLALTKMAFKAPFEVNFKASIPHTQYGYNFFFITCLPDNATAEMFQGCSDRAPFQGQPIAVGRSWEHAADEMCAAVNTRFSSASCVTTSETFNQVKIEVDADGNARVFINDQLVAEGQINSCSSGYYLAGIRTFDAQVDFLEGSLEANEIASVDDLLNQTSSCNTDEAYQRGFEDGKAFCQAHPEECGITTVGENCVATYDFFTQTLKVPCFEINSQSYELEFRLLNTAPPGKIWVELSGFRNK